MTEKVIGRHDVCGGEVVYRSTLTQGWRACLGCGRDSRARFAPLTLESEAAALRATGVLAEVKAGRELCNHGRGWADECVECSDLRAALEACAAAMRRSVEEGCTSHLDATDDAGSFWHGALEAADAALKR